MRTTVRLDDALMAEVKQFAAMRQKTLTSVIEEALREKLAQRRRSGRSKPVKLTTVGGNGLLPGIDLDDAASLLDIMEDVNAAS